MKKLTSKLSTEEQEMFFNSCIEKGTDLQAEMIKKGLLYEDFRYSSYPDLNLKEIPQNYEELDKGKIIDNNVPAISFFAGAGGFDIGFKYAGFNGVAAFEVNKLFCETLKLNFPNKKVFDFDLKNRELVLNSLKEIINIPFEGVFHGGPPCQPFSIASNQRFSKNGENFKRVGFEHEDYGTLLEDYVFYILHCKPKVFVLENVSGLFDMDNGVTLSKTLAKLSDAGYKINEPKIVNLAKFGIPQNRIRLFVVGVMSDDLFIFPKENESLTPCFHVFEKEINNIPNNETRLHKPESLLRYMKLNYGNRDKLGRVDRLDPLLPSKTVIAGGIKGGGRSHLHPYIPRTLSARESARLQTFPDDYIFVGPSARQFTQIGNAVPPLFAYKIATEIYKQFFMPKNKNRKKTNNKLLKESV